MKPKKQLIDRAKRDGTFQRVDRLLSLAYLLHNKAYQLYDETADLLADHGLLIGETKRHAARLLKAYEAYFDDFKQLIADGQPTRDFFADFDDFSRTVHRWADIPQDWQPDEGESAEPAADQPAPEPQKDDDR